MSDSVIVALIGLAGSVIVAVFTLAGVIISNRRSAADMDAKLDKQQAVTDAKLEELTREVREHNNFAKRMPVVEEQIKVVNHRLNDLEEYHR